MATDFILEIDGIKGESTDKDFKGHIDVESFNWGITNSGNMAAGGGGGAGKANFSDISFTKPVDLSSPKLAYHCASGAHIKKATLHVRKQGKDQKEYYTILLEELIVASFGSGGSSGNPILHESFSLNFTKIKFVYKEQKPDGSLGTAPEFSYDVKENVAK
jgi:type VI secretion system secreted protein Hcp